MAPQALTPRFQHLLAATIRATLALFAALTLVSATALSARATEPLDLPSQIYDPGNVVANMDEVEYAIEDLQDESGAQLFVAYVPDFGSLSADDWVDQTAVLSGLGHKDLLIGVATQARRYSVSVDDSLEFTDSEWDRLLGAIESQLAKDNWGGAAIAAARELGESSGAGDRDDSESGNSSGIPIWPVLAAGAGGAGILAVLSSRKRKAKAENTGSGSDGAAPSDLSSLPTEQLEQRASTALVRMDDHIRNAEQDLGFADAQFPPSEIAPFKEALRTAKLAGTEAFKIRQQLDDHIEETQPEKREMLQRIIELTDAASTELEAQSERFDELRNLQQNVDQVLSDSERDIVALESKISGARSELERLALTYPASALASIAQNPDLATSLLENARTTTAQGNQQIAAGDRAGAVVSSRAVSAAVAQAATLISRVETAGTDLQEAGPKLDAALSSISLDIRDAQALGAGDPNVAATMRTAQQAVELGNQARAGGDPLAALAALDSAETALDAALAPARDKARADARASARLDEVLGRTDSTIRATQDFVESRKGAVGPEARTRLSEAIRLIGQAHNAAPTDPLQALQFAEQANGLAQQAQQLAQADVSQYDQRNRPQQGGSNLGGMILGGILIDQLSKGGFGGRSGGYGGGFGGGFGGGSSSSRGRRSGGGRSSGGRSSGRSSRGGRF